MHETDIFEKDFSRLITNPLLTDRRPIAPCSSL